MVEKNGKRYEITERKNHWSVILKGGALSVEYQVPKDICKTLAEVEKYINQESMF